MKVTHILIVDDTTKRFVDMLRREMAAEPTRPDSEVQDGHLLAEVAMKHYEWERSIYALRLMIGVRLTNAAMDGLIAEER